MMMMMLMMMMMMTVMNNMMITFGSYTSRNILASIWQSTSKFLQNDFQSISPTKISCAYNILMHVKQSDENLLNDFPIIFHFQIIILVIILLQHNVVDHDLIDHNLVDQDLINHNLVDHNPQSSLVPPSPSLEDRLQVLEVLIIVIVKFVIIIIIISHDDRLQVFEVPIIIIITIVNFVISTLLYYISLLSGICLSQLVGHLHHS